MLGQDHRSLSLTYLEGGKHQGKNKEVVEGDSMKLISV